eukprot:TRINITY_DN38486_c0_g1_i2.p1 TRINITY_DN38486_c0_g1~~TRINITY_DN38486_c0_g1_i2.p1  ORF type:complete len:421 (+),score=104.81 TRINITY_DN38486_c0_g1_i2:227-1489(+)
MTLVGSTNEPLLVPHLTGQQALLFDNAMDGLTGLSAKTIVSAPLQHYDSSLLGVMSALNKFEPFAHFSYSGMAFSSAGDSAISNLYQLPFEQSDLDALRLLGKLTSLALEHNTLEFTRKVTDARSSSLLAISKLAVGGIDLNRTTFAAITEAFRLTADAEEVSLYKVVSRADGRTDHKTTYCVSADGELLLPSRKDYAAPGIIYDCLKRRETINVRSELRHDPRFNPDIDLGGKTHIRTMLCVPFVSKKTGKSLGAVVVMNKRSEEGVFELDEVRALESMSDVVAQSIDNHDKAFHARQRERNVKAVQALTSRISKAREMESFCEAVVEVANKFVGSERCELFLVDELPADDGGHSLVLWGSTFINPTLDRCTLRVPGGTGIPGQVFSSQESMLVNDVDASSQSGYHASLDTQRLSLIHI